MSAVAELEAGLGAMLHLKPPGVSTSRIKSLTELCQNNIKVCLCLLRRRCITPVLAEANSGSRTNLSLSKNSTPS